MELTQSRSYFMAVNFKLTVNPLNWLEINRKCMNCLRGELQRRSASWRRKKMRSYCCRMDAISLKTIQNRKSLYSFQGKRIVQDIIELS